ncbi:ABC transporter permease [Herbiconiux solani]|uniref:ABC transporter permease n=1 Tax=Herbiconiux solani TaxID=661329 RepID=UPI000826313E|nr:ABC transporter permease [Herbiconiux solani]
MSRGGFGGGVAGGSGGARAGGFAGFGGFWRGVGLIVGLELRQRVRGVAWYVILGVFFALIALVTIGVAVLAGGLGSSGGTLFSSIVFFVLLLASLISPALSGNAINGEREGGTLATIQVTSIATGQIVIGKWLAAWIASLALLVVTVPFLLVAIGIGDVSAATVLSSLGILLAELGVLAALGVGLSGLIRKPLFSVVVGYLTVAALCLGTLIGFGLGGAVTQTPYTQTTVTSVYNADGTYTCSDVTTSTYSAPRFDYYWGLLVINPYVIVADASAGDFDSSGNPTNVFGWIASGVRSAQQAPETDRYVDYCTDGNGFGDGFTDDGPTAEELLRTGVPSWFIGLALQSALAALALFGAWHATRTPARRLARGSRIA